MKSEPVTFDHLLQVKSPKALADALDKAASSRLRCGATGVYRLATIKTSSDSAKAAVQTAEGLNRDACSNLPGRTRSVN